MLVDCPKSQPRPWPPPTYDPPQVAQHEHSLQKYLQVENIFLVLERARVEVQQ